MEFEVRNLEDKEIVVQACKLKWENSWIFIVDAPGGTITCGSFDIDALNSFGLPAAKIVPEPGKPAFTIEDFLSRKITHANELAAQLGVKKGMKINEAIEKLS